MLSKSVTYTYKQVTEILNSRSEPAVVTFVDQVPKSEDEKLKVRFMIRAVSRPNGLTLNQIVTGLSPTLISSASQVVLFPGWPSPPYSLWFQWLRISAISRSDVTLTLYSPQVVLVEPNIPKQKQGAPPPNPKLNTQNNVEWRLELKPGETQTVTIQYTVEFPANKKVEGL